MRYTPGPWATSKDATPEWHTQITVYAEATGERVATVFGSAANAELVAAAPKLLDALQRLLSCSELNMDDMEPTTREAIQNAVDLVTPFEEEG